MENIIMNKELRQEVTLHNGEYVLGVMYEDNFGDMLPYIKDSNVTDINWNGEQLWIDDLTRGRYLSKVKLDKDFVDAFAIRISDIVSRTFNKYTPKLEAETDELRITVLHESVSHTGTIISIRKTPIIKRINHKESIENGYFTEEVANLLSNAVKSRLNIVIAGLPGVGKTELVKYLTNYIFPRDRVITIEDTLEIHYNSINPLKDNIELKVDDDFTYTDAIKVSLRLLPQWILLSEARSKEVQYLFEAISTGCKCITTIHTDNVRKIPYRIINMLGDIESAESVEAMAYDYFDIGVLVDKKQDVKTGEIKRFISQVCMYYRDKTENKCIVLYEKGKLTGEKIPEDMMIAFERAGVTDPYKYVYLLDNDNNYKLQDDGRTEADVADFESTGVLDSGDDYDMDLNPEDEEDETTNVLS